MKQEESGFIKSITRRLKEYLFDIQSSFLESWMQMVIQLWMKAETAECRSKNDGIALQAGIPL